MDSAVLIPEKTHLSSSFYIFPTFPNPCIIPSCRELSVSRFPCFPHPPRYPLPFGCRSGAGLSEEASTAPRGLGDDGTKEGRAFLHVCTLLYLVGPVPDEERLQRASLGAARGAQGKVFARVTARSCSGTQVETTAPHSSGDLVEGSELFSFIPWLAYYNEQHILIRGGFRETQYPLLSSPLSRSTAQPERPGISPAGEKPGCFLKPSA